MFQTLIAAVAALSLPLCIAQCKILRLPFAPSLLSGVASGNQLRAGSSKAASIGLGLASAAVLV